MGLTRLLEVEAFWRQSFKDTQGVITGALVEAKALLLSTHRKLITAPIHSSFYQSRSSPVKKAFNVTSTSSEGCQTLAFFEPKWLPH
jgi:hypothetical protein